MKKVQWQMIEVFIFPEEAGMPTGAEKINVTPRFTVDRLDDAVRLTGIYHISAKIALNEEQIRVGNVESATLIDDVDLDDGTGYFEYAVPFTIDLPAEARDPLNFFTANDACVLDGKGAIGIAWDVECSYQGPVAVKEEIAVEEPVKEITQEKLVEVKEIAQEKTAEVKEVVKEIAQEKPVEVKEVTKEKSAEVNETAETQKEEEAKVVAETKIKTSVAIVESTSFNDADEVLAFIGELDDGLSATSFRSNDVLL